MARYAIGDIQGCYDELRQLLDVVRFDPRVDELWLTGDLVNRGPKSLETLRFVKNLGARAITVLGNHDLHLLALALGVLKPRKKDHALLAVLDAPDGAELVAWLQQRPLLHYQAGWCLVHAGLPPCWSMPEAIHWAQQAESALRGAQAAQFIAALYDARYARWSPKLSPDATCCFTVNALTRMRYITTDGRLDYTHSGPPGSQPATLRPWFDVPHKRQRHIKVIFGHWAALGFHVAGACYGIDSGCLWGGQLTALRFDDTAVCRYAIDCRGYQAID